MRFVKKKSINEYFKYEISKTQKEKNQRTRITYKNVNKESLKEYKKINGFKL